MPRLTKGLTKDQWETIRAERETGSSFPGLAQRHGVSHQAIQKRARKEGWGDGRDVGLAVRRKVAEKVAGIVATDNPKKRAAAMDAAADKVAAVVSRQQKDLEDYRREHMAPDDFEAAKMAKIRIEAIGLLHKQERVAHGLDDATTTASPLPVVLVPVKGVA